MKKQFLWAALAAVTLLTGCSNNDEPNQEKQGNEVTFVIGGIASRTTTDFSTNAVTFEEGDKIGIYASGLANNGSFNNAEFNVTSGLSLTPTVSNSYYLGSEEPTIYAYYPYYSANTTTTITHTVSADQTIAGTTDNFNTNDFMVATSTVNTTSGEISLTFAHKMAMVELSFGSSLTGVTNVEMTIPKNAIEYNLTNSTSNVTGSESTITMHQDNGKFYAIVPPQTITGNGTTALFTITAEDKTYVYAPANNDTEEFTANNIRKITLGLTADQTAVFNLASLTVDAWGTGEAEQIVVVEKEEEPLNMSISLPQANEIIMMETGKNHTTIEAEKWSYLGLTSCEVDGTAESLKFTGTTWEGTSAPNWNTNVVYYKVNSETLIDPSKKYKITFTAKGGTASDKLRVIICDSNNNKFYVRQYTGSNSDTYYSQNTITMNTDFKTCTFDLNPSIYMQGVGSTSMTESTKYSTQDEKFNIVIAFNPTTTGSTYYIKDLKIEEVTEN